MIRKMQVFFMLAVLIPAAAWAQSKGGIQIRSISEVEITKTDSQGNKEVKRIDATKSKVLPGDTVIYTNNYTYNGEQPATDVVIKNPVPEHMRYVDGSAEGKDAKIEFSVDKGATYATADKLMIKAEDGKPRRAAASDYTDIRWTIGKALTKGSKGSVSFKAKVK